MNSWDMPAHVIGRECVCESGRVLDVRTGQALRHVSREMVQSHREPRWDAQNLHAGIHADGQSDPNYTKVQITEGRWLLHKRSGDDTDQDGFHLNLVDDKNSVLWAFDLGQTGYWANGNYFSYRLAGQCLYLAVSEERQLVPIKPEEPLIVRPNPTIYHLLALSLGEGKIIQDFQIDANRLRDCRIENVDEQGLLISSEGTCLRYYRRV